MKGFLGIGTVADWYLCSMGEENQDAQQQFDKSQINTILNKFYTQTNEYN